MELIALLAALALQAEPIVGRASVIDGDTLEIRDQRIRLWGIDAPEGRQTCTRAGETYRCGSEAAFALADELGEAPVICWEQSRDRYRRIVATCSIVDQHDPTFVYDVAAGMVAAGWALDYPQYSRGAYADEQTTARTGQVGVWAGEFQVPWEWRRSRR